MGGGDSFGQGCCQPIIDTAMIDMPGEHRLGVEALHDQHGFTLFLGETDIEVRCKDAVDRQFALEDDTPQGNGGEIKIGEFHGLLDLEGAVTTEEYMGGMGFDMLDG